MTTQSFYIGPPGKRLYCNLHQPATRLIKDAGVLLCPPIGHEYYRAHRACTRLAERLAQCGFPAMRFDYSGTGDSDGDAKHARLNDWLDDIAAAAAFLSDAGQSHFVALAGLRFGATLALLAAARLSAAKTLILWDPVHDGAAYVDTLERLHRDMLRDLERFMRPRRRDAGASAEFLGAEYGAELVQDMRDIEPSRLPAGHIDNVVLVRSRRCRADSFDERLRRNCRVARHVLPDHDHGWTDARRIEESIVAPAIANHVVAALNGIHA